MAARFSGRVAAVGALGAALFARPASAGDPAAADALFRDARAHALSGEYGTACAEFGESMRLDPAPGTLLNLADCEERAGRLAIALEHFLRLEAWVGDRPDRREVARARVTTLAPRVPTLTVTLASEAPAGTQVSRDDLALPASSLSVPLPVEVGSHVVTVTAPGHESARFVAATAEGAQVRLEVAPGPATAPPPRASEGMSPGWLVDGAGIVGLGVGTFFGVRALTERSASDATCSSGVCSTPTGLGQYEAARSDAVVADVALGAGLVALAVGTSILLLSGHHPAPPVVTALAHGRLGASW